MFIGLVIVIQLGWAVDDYGLVVANAFEAVHDHRGYLYQDGMVWAHEIFIDHAVRGRILSGIVQRHLGQAVYAHEMIPLFLMIVPGLNNSGVGSCHVKLPKLDKEIIVAA